jgi:hypothetical protein
MLKALGNLTYLSPGAKPLRAFRAQKETLRGHGREFALGSAKPP